MFGKDILQIWWQLEETFYTQVLLWCSWTLLHYLVGFIAFVSFCCNGEREERASKSSAVCTSPLVQSLNLAQLRLKMLRCSGWRVAKAGRDDISRCSFTEDLKDWKVNGEPLHRSVMLNFWLLQVSKNDETQHPRSNRGFLKQLIIWVQNSGKSETPQTFPARFRFYLKIRPRGRVWFPDVIGDRCLVDSRSCWLRPRQKGRSLHSGVERKTLRETQLFVCLSFCPPVCLLVWLFGFACLLLKSK